MRRVAALAVASLLAGCAGGQGGTYYPPEPPPPPAKLAGMQYLYGSGEAAAISRQAWNALTDYVSAEMKSGQRRGVVLAKDATLAAPAFVPCAGKPPAAVFDEDETVILNTGFEYDDLKANRTVFDDDAWKRWEQTGAGYVQPTPGAREAIAKLRAMGVTVVFNTNRNAFDAKGAAAAIEAAGLGPAVHGQTLFLSGDDAGGGMKDGRRATIASRYCVLAMGGDQLGDFSDLFNEATNGVAERRAATALPGIAPLWGQGWFVLPNPVYGTALQGGADDIFPKDKQWRDPGPAAANKEAQ